MTSAYQQLADRLGLLDRPDLPPDRRQFPVVARSVRHHHGASSRAGRHRLDAVPHPHRLSVPALTGAIMCMGVATANSILVVSFAREQLAEGKDVIAAALEAGATRFRPVLMTALAMIIGMAPMAIEPGQNSPLGRAVIGGLLFATFATLLFVPTRVQQSRIGRQSEQSRASPSRSPACLLTPDDPESRHVLSNRPSRPPRARRVLIVAWRSSRSAPSASPSPASSIAPKAGRRSRPGPTSRAIPTVRVVQPERRSGGTGACSAGQCRRLQHRLAVRPRQRLCDRLEQGHRRPCDEGRRRWRRFRRPISISSSNRPRRSSSNCRPRSSRRRRTPTSAR